jgi:hypothetical protein
MDNRNNFNTEAVSSGGYLLFFFIVIALLFTANFHVPNSGQHTGYVTSVEQSGLIWKTWTVYIKTDPQSSQEDTYCVTDPKVVSDLQTLVIGKDSVTVYYSIPLLTWKWRCGSEQSMIVTIGDQSTVNSETVNTTTVNESQQPLLPYPYEYAGSVVNTGGDWRTTITKAYSSNGYLSHAENYITTSISNGGLMWVSCKDGYQVMRAVSPTSKVIGEIPSTIGVNIDAYTLLSDGTVDANRQYIIDVLCRKI